MLQLYTTMKARRAAGPVILSIITVGVSAPNRTVLEGGLKGGGGGGGCSRIRRQTKKGQWFETKLRLRSFDCPAPDSASRAEG